MIEWLILTGLRLHLSRWNSLQTSTLSHSSYLTLWVIAGPMVEPSATGIPGTEPVGVPVWYAGGVIWTLLMLFGGEPMCLILV